MACAAALLAACAAVGPDYQAPVTNAVPAKWSAPLPSSASGATAANARSAELARWWAQLHDPLLSQLIESAQINSPSVTKAVAQIRQARATLGSSQSAQLPSLTAKVSDTRGNSTSLTGAAITTLSSALDASWELDIFGGTRRSVEAADARLRSSEAGWHDARVSLAAEVANAYVSRRECEALLQLYEADLASRTATQHLTALKLKAGFVSPSDAQRTDASVAESANTLANAQGSCAHALNQLVQLTGLPYADLDTRLASARGMMPRAEVVELAALTDVPAQAITQRPDVRNAERSLAAANADIGTAIANRLPGVSLAGSIGINRISASGASTSGKAWSFGPAISLPVFDAGKGAAGVESARGKYDEALATYQSAVRLAVQDVENALVRVDTIARRETYAENATRHYQQYFDAVQAQYQHGAASLLELEDARRTLLGSQQTLAAARLEQTQAWIALYKAVGGGWQSDGMAAAPLAMSLATPLATQLANSSRQTETRYMYASPSGVAIGTTISLQD